MLAEFFHNDKGKLPFFIDKVEDFPHLKIVRLRGDLDATTIAEIQAFTKKAKKKGIPLNKNLILDLRKVARVDTAAIAQLLHIFSQLKQKKQRMGIINAPDALKDMIGILKLDDVFLTFESQNKALSEIIAWSEDWK